MAENVAVWRDRKRLLFGLPWSFTVYRLTEDRLHIATGLFSTHEEEVRLYRILDITLHRTLEERIFGLGTIHVCSADKSMPELSIRRIKNSAKVRDLLSDLVEQQRTAKGVIGREFLRDGGEHADDMDE